MLVICSNGTHYRRTIDANYYRVEGKIYLNETQTKAQKGSVIEGLNVSVKWLNKIIYVRL